MNKIHTLKEQLAEAYQSQNYYLFSKIIEEVRQLAKAGEQEAQIVFIDWYRKLNPAFDRIIRCSQHHPDIFTLRFRRDLFSKRLLH